MPKIEMPSDLGWLVANMPYLTREMWLTDWLDVSSEREAWARYDDVMDGRPKWHKQPQSKSRSRR